MHMVRSYIAKVSNVYFGNWHSKVLHVVSNNADKRERDRWNELMLLILEVNILVILLSIFLHMKLINQCIITI